MSKSCNGKINKTRYDDPRKPMKPTSFIVRKFRLRLIELTSFKPKLLIRFIMDKRSEERRVGKECVP